MYPSLVRIDNKLIHGAGSDRLGEEKWSKENHYCG